MARITPGIYLLVKGLRTVGLPTLFAVVLKREFGKDIPAWAFILGLVVLAPVLFTAQIIWTEFRQRREAAKMGARLVPRVKGQRFGNLDVLQTMLWNFNHGYPGDGADEMIVEHGTTFNMRMLWEDTIMTVEPENIKTILATDFNNYVKGGRFIAAMDSVLGTGVFNSDGDMWKFHRHITRPFFTRDRITDFDNFETHADDVIGQMKARLRAGFPVDFQDAVSRFTLDSATQFLFGNDVCSLSTGLPYPDNGPLAKNVNIALSPAEKFAVAFLESQEFIAERTRLGWSWPLQEIFSVKTEKPMKTINAYLEPIMHEALERHRAEPKMEKKIDDVDEGDTLLDHLVRKTDDQKILKDEILNILIAGRDTTAGTLTFAVYCLSQNPGVLKRLRAEVLEHVGPTQRPTYDHILPFDFRMTVNATTWPSPDPTQKPLYIPANTGVPYSVFLMHRRADLWGPDAQEFDPDRFIDERLKNYLSKNPFIFLPFNAGPRICLGQQFAYNEMSFMLIKLMQHFDSIELAPDAQPANSKPPADWAKAPGRKAQEKFFPKTHLTMYSLGGLWIRMKEAEQVMRV